MLEGFYERSIWRVHDGVAGAVENERTIARRLLSELTHETALAGSGLTSDQHNPTPLAFGR